MAKTIGGVRGGNSAVNQAAADMIGEIQRWGNVSHRNVNSLATKLSTEKIVERVGGADRTKGSCASLALAYAANKAGMDVLDFRDGESRRFWATHYHSFAEKFRGQVVSDFNQIRAGRTLLATMEKGHEYILAVGKHAAIVRRGAEGYEYLELQDESAKNGFHPLNQYSLRKRFGAKTYCTFRGRRINTRSSLTDIRNIRNTAAVREMMGYIDTPSGAQNKGEGGGTK